MYIHKPSICIYIYTYNTYVYIFAEYIYTCVNETGPGQFLAIRSNNFFFVPYDGFNDSIHMILGCVATPHIAGIHSQAFRHHINDIWNCSLNESIWSFGAEKLPSPKVDRVMFSKVLVDQAGELNLLDEEDISREGINRIFFRRFGPPDERNLGWQVVNSMYQVVRVD